jgi:probable phosphoglycerate mutase
MARLFLVRHARTAETGVRLSGRTAGVALDAAGSRQAAELARHFQGGRIDAVVSSPIQRCLQTARPIAAVLGLPVQRDRAFIEIDYGSWTGRTFAPLRRTRLWDQLFISPSRVAFPGGEILGGAGARAVAGCEALLAARPGGRLVVVSHGDIIKSIVSHYLGQPFDLFQRVVISPASVSVVDVPARGFPRLLSCNGSGPGEWL